MGFPLEWLVALPSVQVWFDPLPGSIEVRELTVEARYEHRSSWLEFGPHLPDCVELDPDESCERLLRLRVVDQHVEVADHRPALILRRVEALDGQVEHARDGVREHGEQVSPLTGRLVRIAWESEGERPSACFAGEDRFQLESLLEGMPLELDLHGIAPGRAVSAGDAWYVEALAVRGLLELESPPDEAWEGTPPAPAPGELEGDLHVRFAGELDRGELRLARLTLAGRLRREHATASLEPDHHIGLGYRVEAEVERSSTDLCQLEGTVLWDLREHRWRELDLTLTVELERVERASWEDRRLECGDRWIGELSVRGVSERR